MIRGMKLALWILPSCTLALFLPSCIPTGSNNNPDVVTGPFDQNGTYREDWADNPSKWKKSGGSRSPHELKSDELPEIASSDQPPENSVPLPPVSESKPTPVIAKTAIKQAPKTTPKKTETTVAKAKPKPKPVVKAKPKSTRYTVKKGDTLSGIASRNGSSVSAIQRGSGISGSLIRPGQVLTIPRK
jgi:LysM repeat protein